jgi:hypothetical protein
VKETPGEAAATDQPTPAATEAAAVGYTGKTAGADGDYGDAAPSRSAGGTAPPGAEGLASGITGNGTASNGSVPATNSESSPATGGTSPASNGSTAQNTTFQVVPGSQNVTQNANQNGSQPASNSSAPDSGGVGSGTNSTSGAGAAGLNSTANMTFPANMTLPSNMTLLGNITTLDGGTIPAAGGGTDSAGSGGKPASKEDDKNYDEKGLPPPADYVEPVTPTEPNSNNDLIEQIMSLRLTNATVYRSNS